MNFSLQTKVIPELIELVENYKPDVIWSDGDWGLQTNDKRVFLCL